MTKLIHKSLMDVHPRELKDIIKDIPTLPVIYQELFQKMQDPNIGVPVLAEIIAKDQALATKILHLVNSAFYGYRRQIKTISRAVVILGFRAVRSAALAISVFEYFKDESSTCDIDIADYWKHSIAVASTCKVLAEATRVDQQEEAFVVGLLHDVGKLIEKRYFPDDFSDLCEAAREQHLSWYQCEKALYQIHHATIGKAVFRAWDFPPTMVEAIQCHHKPMSANKVPQLTALLHVADFIAYQLGYGAPGAFPPEECSPDALKLLGLTLEQTAEHHEHIHGELEHAMEILKLIE